MKKATDKCKRLGVNGESYKVQRKLEKDGESRDGFAMRQKNQILHFREFILQNLERDEDIGCQKMNGGER
jgi:hypothetical protein